MRSHPSALATICFVRHAPRPAPVSALRRLPGGAVLQSVVTCNLTPDLQRTFDAVCAHVTHVATNDDATGVLEAVVDLPAADVRHLDATLWRTVGLATVEPT